MALFTAIGTALGATAAGAFGTGLLATGVAGTAAYSISQSGQKPKSPGVQMPASPKIGAAADKANIAAAKRQRASQRTKSVRTSPLGIGGEAEVAKKTLLGQ